MTADGWRCPECGLILAPSVTEHRCDPPSAEVPAAPPRPDEPPLKGVASIDEVRERLAADLSRVIQRSVSSIDEVRERLELPPWSATVTPGDRVVFTADGPVPVSKLSEAVQRKLLEQQRRNRRWPGSAA